MTMHAAKAMLYSTLRRALFRPADGPGVQIVLLLLTSMSIISFDQPMLNGTTSVISHIPSRSRAIADTYIYSSHGSVVALKVFRCDPSSRKKLKMASPYSCHPDFSYLSQLLQLLLRETPIWHKISVHPNILPILPFHDVQDAKDFTAIVSPWQANGDITRYLRRCPNADRLQLVRAFRHPQTSNILITLTDSGVLGRHDIFTFQCDRTRKSTSGTLKQPPLISQLFKLIRRHE